MFIASFPAAAPCPPTAPAGLSCRPGFFLPVRVFAAVPAAVLESSENGFDAGRLRFFGKLANLADPAVFARRLGRTPADQLGGLRANGQFGGPERYWPISGAIPTASPSPIAGWSRSATARSASRWKDYRHPTARPR